MRIQYRILLFLVVCVSGNLIWAQNPATDNWDNQLFLGNKVQAPSGNWKFSGELQVRLKDDFQALDRWFLEGVATYFLSEHWEIVPDYRFSVKPGEVEHRPGFGILRKDLLGKEDDKRHQLVHQVKWQADIDADAFNNGLRYVFFYNYLLNDRLLPNAAAGAFYRWSENFTGMQFYRVGAGLSYLIDVKHSLNFSYFVGFTNSDTGWTMQGIPLIQLIINLDTKYKYLPAKFINF